ncbi:MAG: hypothetical protein AAF846_11340 [Chloroflexota bacterium]
MNKKKSKLKFSPNNHQRISRFISDLPLSDAITVLDASEDDMPQFISTVVEQTETDALIEAHFTNMITLHVMLSDWAKGSQTQVSIYRKHRQDMQSYTPRVRTTRKPYTPEEKNTINSMRIVVGIVLIILLFLAFTVDVRFIWYGLIIPLGIAQATLFYIDSKRETTASTSRIKNEITIKPQNPYEQSLLAYIENKLGHGDDAIVFSEEMANYRQGEAKDFQ